MAVQRAWRPLAAVPGPVPAASGTARAAHFPVEGAPVQTDSELGHPLVAEQTVVRERRHFPGSELLRAADCRPRHTEPPARDQAVRV